MQNEKSRSFSLAEGTPFRRFKGREVLAVNSEYFGNV
jgi:hypothetical protein